MKRRIMTVADIEKRLGDVYFTNMWGDRFPAREAYVMLGIENGVFSYSGYDKYSEKIVSGSSERICLSVGGKERNPQDYGVSLFTYGKGEGRYICGSDINARNIRLYQENNQNIVTLRVSSVKELFLKHDKEAIIYEDDWRKCDNCGAEERIALHIWSFMTWGKRGFFQGPAKRCSCGKLHEYY